MIRFAIVFYLKLNLANVGVLYHAKVWKCRNELNAISLVTFVQEYTRAVSHDA